MKPELLLQKIIYYINQKCRFHFNITSQNSFIQQNEFLIAKYNCGHKQYEYLLNTKLLTKILDLNVQ